MFEETQEEDKQSSKRGTIIVISVVIVLAIVGTLIYLDSKGALSSSSSSTTSASVAGTPVPAGKADPVSDLRILSTKMDKDYTGTTAMWLVDLKNSSSTYTYSHIQYETTYGGADNSILAQNKGEIPVTLGPGEEQNAQFRDTLYPSGTAWFRVKVTGATATQ